MQRAHPAHSATTRSPPPAAPPPTAPRSVRSAPSCTPSPPSAGPTAPALSSPPLSLWSSGRGGWEWRGGGGAPSAGEGRVFSCPTPYVYARAGSEGTGMPDRESNGKGPATGGCWAPGRERACGSWMGRKAVCGMKGKHSLTRFPAPARLFPAVRLLPAGVAALCAGCPAWRIPNPPRVCASPPLRPALPPLQPPAARAGAHAHSGH